MTVIDTTPRSFKATLRAIFKQSWPIMISQWASMAFGVLDTAMTGHASPTDLATLALRLDEVSRLIDELPLLNEPQLASRDRKSTRLNSSH